MGGAVSVKRVSHPRFRHPPVAEVSLGVQFEPLTELHAAHIGRLWDRWIARYPQHEEHAELAPLLDADDYWPGQRAVMVKFVDDTPLPRTWFLDAAGEYVVQVQRDRFVLNWRRQSATYPHYSELLPRFDEDYTTFSNFVNEMELGSVAPNQCQVTYLNPVPLTGERSCPEGLPGLLEGWSGRHAEGPSLDLGEASIQLRYPISDVDDPSRGWLSINAGTAVPATSDEKVLLLELTARLSPDAHDLVSIRRVLDLAHDAVVTMFAAVTTKQMHTIWEREL